MYNKPMAYEKYIERGMVRYVTSADKNHPTGLFSLDLYGLTQEEQDKNCVLIKLNCVVVRPAMLDILKRVDRKVFDCCTSTTGRYGVENGKLFQIKEKEDEIRSSVPIGVGPEWFYDVYDKLDMRVYLNADAKMANADLRESLLRYTKDSVFTRYQYTIPIYYRDESFDSSSILRNERNIFYADLIRLADLIEASRKPDSGVTADRKVLVVKVQNKMLDLYYFVNDPNLGSKGNFRKNILSRAVDDSSRATILPVLYHSRKIGKSRVGIDSIGVPAHHLIGNYRDFIVKYTKDFLANLHSRGVFGDCDISLIDSFYDRNYIEDKISKMGDQYFRVSKVEKINPDGSITDMELEFNILNDDGTIANTVKKPLYYIELFTIVLEKYLDVSNRKSNWVTRYPTDSMLSSQALKPVPLTLNPRYTKKLEVEGMEFEDFPFVTQWIVDNYQDKIFENGYRISSATAVGYNGDFDGDSVSQKPLKSEEAVLDAEKSRDSLLFIFDYGMDFRRKVGKSAGQTFYTLGRDPKPKDKSKHINPNHPFIKYLVNLEDGALDIDMLCEYTTTRYVTKKPEISIYDTTDVVYNGETINTTIGRLIINKVIFGDLWNNPNFHYINGVINEKRVVKELKYVGQLVMENKVPEGFRLNRCVDLYQELGLRISTIYNSSITYAMLNPDEKFRKKREEIMRSAETLQAIRDNDVVAYQKSEKKMIEFAKEYYKNDDMIELYDSNNKADWNGEYRNMIISVGAINSVTKGSTIVSKSLSEGTEIEDIPDVINQGILGAMDRGVKTAKGGAQYKDIINAMQSFKAFNRDCGSTVGEKIFAKDMWDILNRYVIENGKSILITLDNVNDYLNKEIEIRSPFHCLEKDGHYCSRCVGQTIFAMKGNPDFVNIGFFTAEAASGIMNLFMKSTHVAGASTFVINDLNQFIYPKPEQPLFYTKYDPIDKVNKIYVACDLEWRVPEAAVKKVGTEYSILAHGSILHLDGTDREYAFVLGTNIPSSPAEILKPDQKGNEILKHYIFTYKKDTAICNTTVTFRSAETVYRMFNLFLQGNVSGLPPIESHKMTLLNAFKTNKEISASPITFDILLSTLARCANDLNTPARNRPGEPYRFISCGDLCSSTNTFNALYGADPNRGLFINSSKKYEEQVKNISPVERALRM